MNDRYGRRYTIKSYTLIVFIVIASALDLISASASIGPSVRSTNAEGRVEAIEHDKLQPERLEERAQRFTESHLASHKFRDIQLQTANQFATSTQSLIPIEAIATGSVHALKTELETLGLENGQALGRFVTGYLPKNAIYKLDTVQMLHDVRHGRLRYAARVMSEGDRAIQADLARTDYGVTGVGVTVGVVSDSFDCLGGATLDAATGELPASARVILEAVDCTNRLDEGRALMQIIHDIAPEAELIFHSGGIGSTGVAIAIAALAAEGVDIIVDDAQPPFSTFYQDDMTTRSVRDVVAGGVVHVTAAGNDGRNGYESEFRQQLDPVLNLSAHDFDPSDAVDGLQRFQLPEGQAMELVLQWDEPAFSNSGPPGSAVNLDIYVTTDDGRQLLAGADTNNIGKDPIELLSFFNPLGSGDEHFNLLIVHSGGPAPKQIKYIIQGRFNGQVLEHTTHSATIYGHANAPESISAGAVEWSMTPAYGIEAPLLRSFSSSGGGAVLFNDDGARYVEPRLINKPDIAAPDGVSTSFFKGTEAMPDQTDFEFVGTSAAAPHVAGVIALLLESRPDLSPDAVKRILASSATDIIEREGSPQSTLPTGFDLDSGSGLINAQRAIDLALSYPDGVEAQSQAHSEDVVVPLLKNVSVGGSINTLLIALCILIIVIRRLPVRYF